MSAVAAARLSGQISQRVFDVLLRTLAEPGRPRRLPVGQLPGDVPQPLWLALALADVDIHVSVDNNPASPFAALVHDATGATIANVEGAWIVVLQDPTPEVLARVNRGTALAPEAGARLALGVDRIWTNADSGPRDRSDNMVTLELAGPGVPGTRTLHVDGLSDATVDMLGTASGPFPTGIDTWLFAPDGDVVAIARTTELRRI